MFSNGWVMFPWQKLTKDRINITNIFSNLKLNRELLVSKIKEEVQLAINNHSDEKKSMDGSWEMVI